MIGRFRGPLHIGEWTLLDHLRSPYILNEYVDNKYLMGFEWFLSLI